jgi:hypothetical protein
MISKPIDYNSNKSILLQNDRLIETFWPVPVRLKQFILPMRAFLQKAFSCSFIVSQRPAKPQAGTS